MCRILLRSRDLKCGGIISGLIWNIEIFKCAWSTRMSFLYSFFFLGTSFLWFNIIAFRRLLLSPQNPRFNGVSPGKPLGLHGITVNREDDPMDCPERGSQSQTQSACDARRLTITLTRRRGTSSRRRTLIGRCNYTRIIIYAPGEAVD